MSERYKGRSISKKITCEIDSSNPSSFKRSSFNFNNKGHLKH